MERIERAERAHPNCISATAAAALAACAAVFVGYTLGFMSRDLSTVSCDICVVGAGIAGVSAALEAARLGRTVVIIDAAPALGGQAIGSIIGTIIGLYTHGPTPYQITHLVADDLIRDLDAEGSLYRRKSMTNTVTFLYDEVRPGRWMEAQIARAGVTSIVGAVLTGVAFDNRRVQHIDFATRFGAVRINANG